MALFNKKCELCGTKITRGREVKKAVKVPEFKGFREKDFCDEEHAEIYANEVKGTKRTRYCPSCGV
jgi:hypothetical protein